MPVKSKVLKTILNGKHASKVQPISNEKCASKVQPISNEKCASKVQPISNEKCASKVQPILNENEENRDTYMKLHPERRCGECKTKDSNAKTACTANESMCLDLSKLKQLIIRAIYWSTTFLPSLLQHCRSWRFTLLFAGVVFFFSGE